jgi:hypothetical protein
MWCGSQVVIVQKLLDRLCSVWLGVVGVHNQSSLILWTMKRTDYGKNMINILLARRRLLRVQNINQMESIRIPHDSQHCFRTAGCLAFSCCAAFRVRKPDVFMLVREVKTGLI